MDKLLQICLKNRLLIVLSMLGIIGLGVFQYTKLPTDAFPDISPIMVPVFAEAHGMAPEEVERLITFPIESAMNGLPGVRLSIIVPVALGLIFLLLFISLGSMRSAALIFTNVPLALIGGILGLFLTKNYLSVPASIGFIALFGIAMQNGLVLASYVNQLREEGRSTRDAVVEACTLRLRPVLMTALATVLGIAPILFSTGVGSEVQRPLAVVVVFGLLSSTFLTLVLIPTLYEWFAPKLATDTKK